MKSWQTTKLLKILLWIITLGFTACNALPTWAEGDIPATATSADELQSTEASTPKKADILRGIGFQAAADVLEAMEAAGLSPTISPDVASASSDVAQVEISDSIPGASLKVVQRGKSVKTSGPYFLLSDRGNLYQQMALWAIGQGKAAVQLQDGSVQLGPFDDPTQALKAAEDNPQWNASCVGSTSQGDSQRLFYSVLRIDPTKWVLRGVFAGSFGMGRAPMSFLFSKSQAVAMVNGGYYHNSYPLGTLIHQGIPMGRPIQGRSAMGITDQGAVFFGDGAASFGVRIGDKVMPITDFNIPPKAGSLSIFYPSAYRPSAIAPGSALLWVKNGVASHPNNADFLLMGVGEAADLLSKVNPGDPVELIKSFAFPAFESCPLVIQGGPMVLENHTIIKRQEGLSKTITHRRHPRTLAGIDDRGLVFLVIDGRNGHSDGVTLEEAAMVALEEGLTAALNLDGGGSSQIIWRSVTVNKPSDRRERPLPYGIGVFAP